MLVSGELRYGSRVETVAGESSDGGWLDGLGHLRVDLVRLTMHLAKWGLLVFPLGVAVGSACAGFLWSLDWVTDLRFSHPWLLFCLPVFGALAAWIYHVLGREAEGGSNLVIDAIHEPGTGIPPRMAPLVYTGTLLTHLGGGSAGREGTAVQMGGGIASALAGWYRMGETPDRAVLLMAGVAAGFSGVFGTPFTAAVFAMEVLALGRIQYKALTPCLMAALFADWGCGWWGVGHTHYYLESLALLGRHLDWLLLGKVAAAGVAFGLAGRLFSWMCHTVQAFFRNHIQATWVRAVAGGCGVIGLALVFGQDYLGLGVTQGHPGGVSIVSAFGEGGARPWSWLLKIFFTALTVSSGFKGGEVTPLFFIGATLGNTLAGPLHAPVDLMAGLGFVAVFAATANTPLACTVMAVELFGAGAGAQLAYFATACFTAYLFAGHSGIYLSQRIGTAKYGGAPGEVESPLGKVHRP